MNKLAKFSSAILAALFVCGCGGSGGGGAGAPSGPSGGGGTYPLSGVYSGKGTVSNSSDALTANIGVGSDAKLCGEIDDSQTKTKTILGALVSQAGLLSNGSFQTADKDGNVTATGSLSGQLTPSGSNENAVLTTTVGTQTVTYTFSNLQSVASANAKARLRKRRKALSQAAKVAAP